MTYDEFRNKTRDLNPLLNHKDYILFAKLFQELVNQNVKEILEKHSYTLSIEINKIKLATKGSALNSSTAYGYILEEFIVKQLPSYYGLPVENTNNSAYDFMLKCDDVIDFYVNLKVEKDSNRAVCAAKKLVNLYNSNNKPKLYLILKLAYNIDEDNSDLIITDQKCIYMESFIKEYLVADRRNWSEIFNPLSGRIQTPNNNEFESYTYDKIPPYQEIRDRINDIEPILTNRKNSNYDSQ